jgi:hypothetical protein
MSPRKTGSKPTKAVAAESAESRAWAILHGLADDLERQAAARLALAKDLRAMPTAVLADLAEVAERHGFRMVTDIVARGPAKAVAP